MYTYRNLELVTGRPNLLIIFLFPGFREFATTLCLATIAQCVGLLVTNFRFHRAVWRKKKFALDIATKKVAPVATTLVKKASSLNLMAAAKEEEEGEQSEGGSAGETADGGNSFEDMMAERKKMEEDIQYAQASFAIIRNCEEISEKVNFLQCPFTVYILLQYGIIETTVDNSELLKRAAVAFAIETVGDGIKVWVDSMFGIFDTWVKNRIDFYGAVNLAAMNVLSEALFWLRSGML